MKKSIGPKTLVYPHPVFIVATYDKDNKPNMLAISWGGICCSKPPCVAISLRKSRYSFNNIVLNKAFTVNIPSTQYVKESDFMGIVSGSNVEKFAETGLHAIKSEYVNAPYIEEFPLSLCCKLIKTVEIGSHIQFIGEIIDVLVDKNKLDENNVPILESIDPFCYDSATKNYYSVGEKLIKGFSIKEIK